MLVEKLQREIELIDKEMLKMERLNLTSDNYYIVLQTERLARQTELNYCKEIGL